MVIDVIKNARELKIKLPDLITRPVGRRMYNAVAGRLDIAGEEETVILDFDGIKVIDSSFVDEYIVKLVLDSRERNFYLKLRNISHISEINIDSVFNSYSNYKNRRIVISREEMGRNNRFYIGPLSEGEGDILDFLRINFSAGIEDIMRFSGLDIEELKKVLEELSFLRVIKNFNGEFSPV